MREGCAYKKMEWLNSPSPAGAAFLIVSNFVTAPFPNASADGD